MRDLDPELLERAGELNIRIAGTWGNKRIQQEIDTVEQSMIKEANAVIEGADVIEEPDVIEEEVKPVVTPVDKFQTVEWANERAALIWEGQSPTLSLLERVGRIKLGLKDKGFTDFDKLVIPTKLDYKRYL